MYEVTDPQGICLIINISHYEPQTGLSERLGSNLDVKRVSRLFGDILRFNVCVREDLTGDEIKQCFETLVANEQEAMQSHGCFVCFLMAHGSNEKVIGCDGISQTVAGLTRLVDSIACPALANKPKVFFVHASRGSEGEPGAEDSLAFSNFFLGDSDFLVCFANTEGSPVLDDPESGSAFLRVVCALLEQEHQCEHLDDILTGVNRYLKSNPVQRAGRLYYYVSEKVSSMTKKCYVNPDLAHTPAGDD